MRNAVRLRLLTVHILQENEAARTNGVCLTTQTQTAQDSPTPLQVAHRSSAAPDPRRPSSLQLLLRSSWLLLRPGLQDLPPKPTATVYSHSRLNKSLLNATWTVTAAPEH